VLSQCCGPSRNRGQTRKTLGKDSDGANSDKECRDTSVTMALQAGADPYYVAAQHAHSLQTMMRDYAAFIAKGDRDRNLAAINAALGNAANKPDFAEGAQ
jgi:hypothetical protein